MTGPASPEAIKAFHPFLRLQRLLDGVEAGRSPLPDGRPVSLQIGEPQNQPPAFVAEALQETAGSWGRYPPPRGTPDYLAAAGDWLARRYGLPAGFIDNDRNLLPLPGTREGLFFAALMAAGRKAEALPPDQRPAILLPNPAYQVYMGAALMSGCEPVFVPATADNNFQPDYATVPPETLARAALAYVCSPANPQGTTLDEARIAGLIELARAHGFTVVFDECYAEIYRDRPPVGALEVAARRGLSLDNFAVFHSLSKRSNAAGLRCGFVAAGADFVDGLDAALRVGGAGVPVPVAAAGARLWRDEAHVTAIREGYRANFALAEEILGPSFGARAPDGGFFLWLAVGDGEAAALALWREAGLKVLPGAYMGVADAGQGTPGDGYIRVALVYDAETMRLALSRLAEVLGSAERGRRSA